MEPQWSHVKAVIIAAVLVLGFAIVVTLTGCPRPIPPPVPPTPDADAGAVASCASACARLQQLGCPAGRPTPKGVPCVEVCEDVNSSGLIVWDFDCVARALTCGATDRCAR